MVSSNDPGNSRAGTLALIGGEIAFDFANTSSGRGWPTHHDHLRCGADVANWAGHARVLAPEDSMRLRDAVAIDRDLDSRLLSRALALREDIYMMGVALASGRPPPQDCADRISGTHAQCLCHARLVPFRENFMWSWPTDTAPIEAILGPIALSAMTTLIQADLSRIKQCQGEKCGWLFLDTTKNKRRRWCEMEICGNRAKQKRFSAKKDVQK